MPADAGHGGGSAADGAGEGTNRVGGAAEGQQQAAAARAPSMISRVLQFVAVLWIIASFAVDMDSGAEAAQAQCGV